MRTLAWMGHNWKSLGAIFVAIGASVLTYTRTLDARIDDIEVAATEVRRDIDDVAKDVVDIRCMAIAAHQNGDPLNCIKGSR